MDKKETHVFRIILVIFQLFCIASFIFYIILEGQVYDAHYNLLVSEDSWVYALENTMYTLILIPGLLTLLAFIPTVIADIVGFIVYFAKRKDAVYLVLVIVSFILEFVQILLGLAVLGMRQ